MPNDSTATKLVPNSTPNATPQAPAEYILGHSPEEIRRLENQSAFLRPATRDFLERVGISSDMRVLDVGSGAGDVAFLAADLVTPTGEVIGFDRAEAAVSVANARAHAKGLKNVRFIQCDLANAADLAAHGPFDAVIGRLVLMHQPNPLEVLRSLLRLVNPGGLVGFQEPELTLTHWSSTPLPTFEKYGQWIDSILHFGKDKGSMARESLIATFAKAFDEAGITHRRIICSTPVESSLDQAVFEYMADTVRSFGPNAQKMGLTPPFESETFKSLLRHEVTSKSAVFTYSHWIGAAGRLPVVRVVEN